MALSAAMKSAGDMTPARTSSENYVGARTNGAALQSAIQHQSTGDDDGGQIAGRRPHDQRRRGLVATRHQHAAIRRIATNSLLNIHRRQVAKRHGRWAKIGFTAGEHWKHDG